MNNRNNKRLLLVDDSSDYRDSLLGLLELEGYIVEQAATPQEAHEKLDAMDFDLALVDLHLVRLNDPNDISGLEIAKHASELGILCIIITAIPTVDAIRIALRSRDGTPLAVEFITKGDPQALLDSISLSRRNFDEPPIKAASDPLYIDLEKQLVWKYGKKIDLTTKQFTLLSELYKRDGGVCNASDLNKAIYPEDVSAGLPPNDRRLRNLIERVKEKIDDKPDDNGSHHEYIVTEFGRGYRYNKKE